METEDYIWLCSIWRRAKERDCSSSFALRFVGEVPVEKQRTGVC